MRYAVRPISDRTWITSSGRESTRFSAKWGATEQLLVDEVGALGGRNLVLEMDISEGDLRINGELRANARPATGAVVVAFESKHGPLLYRCDRFFSSWSHQGPDWWHNVRAIALTLQALRAVDRYGATQTGEQYAGFKALPAGRAMPSSHMTREQAYDVLYDLLDAEDLDQQLTDEYLFRKARAVAHPDRAGGDRALWDEVEQAGKVLGLIT